MELIRSAVGCSATTADWRREGSRVGFVATMGALHRGHGSLIRRAVAETDRVLVSIFVNPTQFGDRADLDRYPRDEAADLALCEREGVHAVWAPPVEEVYPRGEEMVRPDPGPVGELLEGSARPGHFAGVLQVVRRLFEVVGPCRAYFGEKDAQQLSLIRLMVQREDDLGEVEIVACPTIREADGLAVASRNALLTPEEREQASCLFLALTEAAEAARAGERDASVLVALMAREVGATPLARLEYAAVVDPSTFQPLSRLEGPARAVLAVAFPSARLIDGLILPEVAA